jgi:hypothetical protein
MATYEEIYGKRVKEFDSDPTLENSYEGQVWYDKSTGVLKSVISFSAFSSATPMSNARSQAIAGIGTKDATIAAGLSTSDGTSEEYNGTGWSSGGTLNNPATVGTGCGTLTAGSRFGGIQPTPAGKDSNYHEYYDGTSWTAQTGMPFDSYQNACGGTQTANIVVQSFFNPNPSTGAFPTATAEWNGSSWTAGGSISTARRESFSSKGGAAQTATFIAGGTHPSGVKNNTELYNGTSWTSVANINTARLRGGGGGTSTAGIIVGGSADPPRTTATESWDGSSWTTNNFSLATAVNTQGSAFAESTNGVSFGGTTDSGTTAATEELNTSINTITAAAWASGGTLPITMRQNMSFGTQTAAINCGGYAPPGTKDDSLSYDGTSWTATPDLNAAARFGGVAGTQGAGLQFSGIQPDTTLSANVQSWNGSTWSNNPYNVSTGTYGNMGCGTQTAALKIGGAAPGSPSIYTTTEEYDGEGWTAGGTMPQGRYGGGGNGLQTTCVFAGGQDATGPSSTSCVEYDGTSWTAGGSLNSARGSGAMGAGASSDSALVFGGAPAQSFNEGYDGTSFSTRPSLATGRGFSGGNGIATAALIVAGGPPSGTTTNVEEFTGETETITSKTLTTS